ncbi:MAG: 5-oxoprolinase subunit PxpB [Armatimonadota bacterium]|nr:5-oxoprolinase subunit PxpB [Armatimonadota bacterium]MDR7533576.1 5-oxoprolinase subunit PxpB [Armatimonadota bacterium]MDR7537376.1 5-oxoprolinase subunit PxpB [Armatimonadota bacterium]
MSGIAGRWPRLLPLGDCGLLVEFAPEVSPEVNALVRGAEPALARLPGVCETVPAFRSVLAVYDPRRTTFDRLAEAAEAAVRAAGPARDDLGRLHEIPVAYGGEWGPDLEAVAAALGLSAAEVVALHAGTTYRVYMLGFSPGFPYLGLLPEALRLPRRATPRTRVPAGSVAIADAFAGIYAQDTAGGWHLLGRTPVRLFDPARPDPFLLAPGDRVRFVPVPEIRISPAPPAASFVPRRPVFDVLDPGLLTTVQDAGRFGWRRFGVPASGPMDRRAHAAANLAVGNAPGAAAIEMTFPGPKLRAVADAEIAVAGADLGARLNHSDLEPGRPTRVRPGDLFTLAAPRGGQWLYLAVAGGVDGPEVLGSRATWTRGGASGVLGRPVRAGEILGVGEGPAGPRRRQPVPLVPAGRRTLTARVVLGPQADAFAPEGLAALLGATFEITVQRDRSGARLRGVVLRHRTGADIASDGLLPGAVQVPADGSPVVILADGPTTGGYVKAAAVIGADLDAFAQLAPGDRVRFEAVTVARAHDLLRTAQEDALCS